jgi:Na+/H+-translocating membrane pyrophosphatase
MGGLCSTYEEMRYVSGILVGKLEVKIPLGRPRRTWEDNIGMNLTDIGWEGTNWIHLAQDKDQ